MTILAGFINRCRDKVLNDRFCETIRSVMSRDAKDEVVEYRDENAFLAKVDIGVYSTAGLVVEQNKCVTLLAGEPLLECGSDWYDRSREEDLRSLHRSWKSGVWDLTASTRGVFCAVQYATNEKTVTLISDRLGIRPLYYTVTGAYVFFATALRIFEALPQLSKEIDLVGLFETVAYGYPLNNRTGYLNIKVLRAGEICQITANNIRHDYYWRWDKLEVPNLPEEDLLDEAYRRFEQTIDVRLRGDKTVVAYLSGGMDSRCVVSLLLEKGMKVHTFNFGMPKTQDQAFGAEFAKEAGAIHTEKPMGFEIDHSGYARTLSKAWSKSKGRVAHPVDRPGLAWSGEGGSVAVGHVYVTKEMYDLMRAGQVKESADLFLKTNSIALPSRIFFKSDLGKKIAAIPKNGIIEELNASMCSDKARALHLFLMLNDQRRHLCNHFDEIDLHRTELHLPFFDGHFLELILSAPPYLFLRHALYTKWLYLFPPSVTKVPWQTYPGHIECPVESGESYEYQWDDAILVPLAKYKNRVLQKEIMRLVKSRHFPSRILRRWPLGFALLLTRLGIRNYGYVLEMADAVNKKWRHGNDDGESYLDSCGFAAFLERFSST